jgi:hypothetical protein
MAEKSNTQRNTLMNSHRLALGPHSKKALFNGPRYGRQFVNRFLNSLLQKLALNCSGDEVYAIEGIAYDLKFKAEHMDG